ncbi:hypothetical protein CVCC1112_95 [Paenarthrobacter nicotinovorans]|nr:hypothetical protein CVCC1112_95 [Paenarthrobacter nicotinovorans]
MLPLVATWRNRSALGRLVTAGRLVARRRNIAWLRLGAGLLRLRCFIWGTHGITVDRRLKVA